MIRETEGVAVSSITLAPEKYNELYKKFGNLNRMLGWGHAKVIENLLDLRPDCPRALSDKFADASLIKRAFSEKGKHIQLDARTKAESDVAVAAASIIARERFINWLRDTSRDMAVELPSGIVGPEGEDHRRRTGRVASARTCCCGWRRSISRPPTRSRRSTTSGSRSRSSVGSRGSDGPPCCEACARLPVQGACV